MDDDAKPASAAPGTIQLRVGPRGEPTLPEPAAVAPTQLGEPARDLGPPALPPARYALGPELARGGMGRVVDATDTVLGRAVAVKEALAPDAESRRRFAREIRITARLEHPAIVPVHDAGTTEDGTPFYVMRKIGGRPLEQLVAAADRLDHRLALIPHVVAAAHAVAHAHARGIVHRDLKPSNILCGDLGETIVIDWGLAKELGEPDDVRVPASIHESSEVKTRAGIVFGTPGFMAPEQLRGLAIDPRCDVYALGATLYHLLSRQPPHHAHTADEMMRAAAAAPPTPIGALVAGVPRELATIIDKALAHDPRRRYQDARALAEDLQRFLTGQLVASHHYTRRERVIRFVRRNRALVGVTAAALAALAIGGAIAVGRVVDARDRADAEARLARDAQRHAEDRNERLVLQQARSKVAVNPTEAVAMLKPLAAGPRWREVRSIAEAARAAGIAWSLPAPRRTASLELSRDGRRALVAGDDGSLRLYDLDRRAVRTVVARGPRRIARLADGDRIVAWQPDRLDVIDAGAGATRGSVAVSPAIADLAVVGATAYWADTRGALWRLELGGTVPLQVAVPEPVVALAPSPDGRWIALVGSAHLLLLDRAQPAAPALELLFGQVRELDWADDARHLAALVELGERTERQVVDLAFDERDADGTDVAPRIVHRIRVGYREHLAFSRGGAGAPPRIYAVGPLGVGMVSRNETTPRRQLVGDPIGLRESIDGAVVAGGQGGLAVLTDDGDHTIPVPVGRLEWIDASARAPYVVGLIEGRMLVWDLSELLPRRIAGGAPTLARFAGDDAVFAAYLDRPAAWIDLASLAGRPAGRWAGLFGASAASRDGHAVCVIVDHRARLVVRGGEPVDVGPGDAPVFAGHQLVVATLGGQIDAVDVATRARRVLVARDAGLAELVASRAGGWVAAAFADRRLWRIELATGEQQVLEVDRAPAQVALQDDGTVLVADGRWLRAWRPGAAAVEPVVALPHDLDALGLAGPGHVVAFAAGGTGVVIELGPPARVGDAFEVDADRAVMSPDTGLIVTANRGSIDVIDPLAAHRWTLASAPGLTFLDPQIASDGRHVLGRRVVVDREKRDAEAREVNAVLAWRLVTPADAAATARWLDRLTNAVVDPRTASLGWRGSAMLQPRLE